MNTSDVTDDMESWTKVVHDSALARRSAKLTFHPLPVNHDRRDAETRRTFIARDKGEPICHLTVGQNLRDLYDRSAAFAAAYPLLAPEQQYFSNSLPYQLVLRTYVNGVSLNAALRADRKQYQDALNAIATIRQQFDESRRESDVARVENELRDIETLVLAVPSLAAADKAIIRETIFPTIRRELADKPISIRLAHGDLTCGNILLTADGNPRMIDFEFSEPTHFHELEWIRLLLFSHLSTNAIRDLQVQFPPPPIWARLLFWVRQIALEHRVNQPSAAAATVSSRIAALTQIIHSDPRLFGRPLFLGFAPGGKAKSIESEPTNHFAQLFWAFNDERFDEARSTRHPLTSQGERQTLEFRLDSQSTPAPSRLNLRFDPLARVGLITISRIAVQSSDGTSVFFDQPGMNSFQEIEASGTGIILARCPEFTFLSNGEDPQLHFSLQLPEAFSTDIKVIVEFDFNDSLNGIASVLTNQTLLHHRATELTEELMAAKAESERRAITLETDLAQVTADKEQSVSTLNGETAAANADFERRIANLTAELAAATIEKEKCVVTLTGQTANLKAEFERRIAELTTAKADKEQYIATLIDQTANLKAEFERRTAELTTAKADKEQYIATLIDQTANLKAEFERRTAGAAATMENAERQAASLRADLAATRLDLHSSSTEIAQIANALSGLENTLRLPTPPTETTLVGRLSGAIAALEAYRTTTEQLSGQREENVESLRSELAQLSEGYDLVVAKFFELEALAGSHPSPPRASLRDHVASVHASVAIQLQELQSLRRERLYAHQELQILFAAHHDISAEHRETLERVRTIESDLLLWRDRYHNELRARRQIDRSWEWKLVLPLRDFRRALTRFTRRFSKRSEPTRAPH